MGYTIILDTETTSLDKPFCYDISWIIMDMESGEHVDFKSFVVEQVWHTIQFHFRTRRFLQLFHHHNHT